MSKEKEKSAISDSLGRKEPLKAHLTLCREPWESYYILRRGILPCCHGSRPIAPMSEWATAWNSPALREIRWYLSQGKLSPYCMDSLSCPIVQRHMAKKRKETPLAPLSPRFRSPFLRLINRLCFRIPGKLYRILKAKKPPSFDVPEGS
ncbi:MAG: SPASM domain-containing protein [Candidatus Aminicenantales bacterium]